MLDSVEATPPLQARTWDWLDRKSSVHWVFGMRWLPALGSKGQKAMQRSLRQQGVAWAVNHGKQVRLIGVQAQASAGAVNGKMASAAVAFAHMHPQGVHALCLEVQGMGVWMVASADGCVLSDTDRWFDTLDEAGACVQALRERHEQVAFESAQWDPQACEEPDQQPAFLQPALLKHCRFCRLPSLYVPWVLLLLGLLAFTGLVLFSFDYLPAFGRQTPAPDKELVPVRVEPITQIHPNSALEALWRSWHSLPVDPEGWLLQSVTCRIDGAKAFCKAAYKRRESGAHNEGLLRQQPEGWLFEAESIERAFYRRTIDMPLQALQPHMMASTVFGLTQLQRLSPKVASLSIGTPTRMQGVSAVAVSGAPQYSPVGLDPMPAARLAKRSVTVRLALRHAERITSLSLPLQWREAQLSVVHGAQIDKLHGYLMLNLQGDWLETQ